MLYHPHIQGRGTPGLRNTDVGEKNVRNLSHVKSAVVTPFPRGLIYSE